MKTKQELITEFNLTSKFKNIRIGEPWDDNYKADFKPLNEVYILFVGTNDFDYNTSIADLGLKIQKLDSAFKKTNSAYILNNEIYLQESGGSVRRPARANRIILGKLTIHDLNKKLNKNILCEDDILFAFRCVISDALCFVDYRLDDFLSEFGYDGDIKSIRKGEAIYKACEDSYRKLSLSDNKLYELLDNLSDLEIE